MSATEECEDTNVRLVQLVESHPCLWDPEDAYYANSTATENSWREIATELEMPGKVLKKRWTNIRTVFRRRFNSKNQGVFTKQYYLTDALQFLVPIFQVKNEETYQELANDDNPDVSYPQYHEENAATHEDDGTDESENIEERLTKNGIARQNCKKRTESPAIIEYIDEKRRKLETPAEEPRPQSDSDEKFLLSLKDDMQEMTPAQKRSFKRRIFELLEDILGSDSASDPLAIANTASTSQKSRVKSARFKKPPAGE